MRRFLTFIRFSHTIFALPFALGSMLVAAHGFPSIRLFFLILLAMVFARTAAMVFNRVVDWEIDKKNPRTEGRHQLVSYGQAIGILLASSMAFIASTYFINWLCFVLSPIALCIIFFYSLTKRFTSYSHFFLGLALAVSPVGAWIAVRDTIDLAPLVLAAAVLLWVAGFDLIYATQDHEFDAGAGLHSLVVRFGVPGSLKLAQILHGIMFLFLLGFGWTAGLGLFYWIAMLPIFGALVYEHRVARGLDVNAINQAFFNSNAFVGAVFLLGIFLDQVF